LVVSFFLDCFSHSDLSILTDARRFDPTHVTQRSFESCVVSIEAPFMHVLDFPEKITRARECKFLFETNIKPNEEVIEVRLTDEFGREVAHSIVHVLNADQQEYYPYARCALAMMMCYSDCQFFSFSFFCFSVFFFLSIHFFFLHFFSFRFSRRSCSFLALFSRPGRSRLSRARGACACSVPLTGLHASI
jgi:hypothetical protein